jgi:hypothetical protein
MKNNFISSCPNEKIDLSLKANKFTIEEKLEGLRESKNKFLELEKDNINFAQSDPKILGPVSKPILINDRKIELFDSREKSKRTQIGMSISDYIAAICKKKSRYNLNAYDLIQSFSEKSLDYFILLNQNILIQKLSNKILPENIGVNKIRIDNLEAYINLLENKGV